MKLIINVKITDVRLGYPYDQGRGPWVPRYERFEVFKYCLASYAVLEPLVDKFLFYIELADNCVGREEELETYIRNLYSEHKLDLHWRRNNYTRDWRLVCEEHFQDDSEVIWFAGNDDHIFIDSDLALVGASIDLLKNDPDPLSVVYYSHWPEQARMSHWLGGELTSDRNFVRFYWQNYDGIQMFKAARFKRYWYDADYGNTVIFRPDHLYNEQGYCLPSWFYAPTKEMVRHYDGYVHVGHEVIDVAPALYIPPGFFDQTMKLKIGFDERDQDCTNFNPASVNLYNTNPAAADYRWVEEDIPLFWKDRIAEIIKPDNYDHSQQLIARDRAFLRMSRISMHCFGQTFGEPGPPVDWFSKHFRAQS